MVAAGNTSRQPAETVPPGERIPVDPPLSEGFSTVGLRLRELVEFASYYLAAQADRLKLTAINLAMFAILGLVAAVVGIAVVLTAGVLLVLGVSDAIAALLGHTAWAGELITSALILGGLILGTVIVFKIVTKSSRKKVVAAYEQRKSQQRSSLGIDVGQEAHR